MKDWDEDTELGNPESAEVKAELVGKLNKYWLPILGKVHLNGLQSPRLGLYTIHKETPQY